MYWELVLPSGTVNFSDRWPTCDDLKLAISSQIDGLSVTQCTEHVLVAQSYITLLQKGSVNGSVVKGERVISVRQVDASYPGTGASVEVEAPQGLSPSSEVDEAQFAGIFSIAFASVVGFYLLSLKIALVLGVVRRT